MATSRAPVCSTGRSTPPRIDPWYTRAEDRMGVTRTHGIPGLPGNNNFKVLEAGAKKLGYKEVPHRPHGDQFPAARRPRLVPADRFLLPGLQVGRQMVDALCRGSQGRGDRQSRVAAERAGAEDRARCVGQGHRRRLCRQGWPAASPEGTRRLRGRQQHRKPALAAELEPHRCSRTVWPIPPARSGRTTCAT